MRSIVGRSPMAGECGDLKTGGTESKLKIEVRCTGTD
jgi:hypothetical protein